MVVTKESLLCDLYTDLKPVLEEEEVYLKIIRSSLRNGRETQHLQVHDIIVTFSEHYIITFLRSLR
jgi:hypothetical protein